MKCPKPIRMGKMDIPCGKCMVCKKAKALRWSQRLLDQLTTSSNAVFVTLTYRGGNDELMNLNSRELQLFIKRVRKKFSHKKIKFFANGEYGDKTFRPHYHILFFGLNLEELETRRIYGHLTSKVIEKLWYYGNNEIGAINKERIFYTTGYILKKMWGNHGKEMYQKRGLIPPFHRASRGLGLEFATNYEEEVRSREYIDKYYSKKLGLPSYGQLSAKIDYNKEIIETMRKEKCTIADAKKTILKRNTARLDLMEAKEKLFGRRKI